MIQGFRRSFLGSVLDSFSFAGCITERAGVSSRDKLGGLQMGFGHMDGLSIERYIKELIGCSVRAWVHCWGGGGRGWGGCMHACMHHC
jgi:hypothetical protein